MKRKIIKESEIKEEIKKVPKDRTLAQRLLPGIILLIIGTILTLSIRSIQLCDAICLVKGGGLGTIGLIVLYIIGKALKDYGFY